jgi:hypothetical protein
MCFLVLCNGACGLSSFPKTPKVMESSPCTPPGGQLSKDSKGHGIKPMHPSSWTAFQRLQRSWNQAHAPLLVERFPKIPRTRSETSWFSGSHNYKTKYLHRYPMETHCSVFRLTWTAMLLVHVKCGQGQEAMELF